MPQLSPRERDLTERLDEANETVRQLRAALLPDMHLRLRLNLLRFSKTEAALLLCMSDGNVHANEALRMMLDQVNLTRENASLKSTNVTICKLRQKLKRLPAGPAWVTIETHWGVGYSMSASSIANLRALTSIGPRPAT